MKNPDLRKILQAVEKGEVSAEQAFKRLREMQYDELGFAKTDLHREARCGLPEAIFCEGKTIEQIRAIARSLLSGTGNLLATHASEEVYQALVAEVPDAVYCAPARTVTVKRTSNPLPPGEIAVVCAGTADIPVAEEARVTAEFLDNKVSTVYDVGVAALHRLISHSREVRLANVVIAVAGMEGALAGVVAGMVARPVIAVPTSVGYGASFDGLAPLLTMMNSCAAGVSVVNIDNGFGAACVASLINHTGYTHEDRREDSTASGPPEGSAQG